MSQFKSQLPVIILTGHAERDNVIQAKGAGVNGFLVKPISIRSLAEQMVRALNARIKGVTTVVAPKSASA